MRSIFGKGELLKNGKYRLFHTSLIYRCCLTDPVLDLQCLEITFLWCLRDEMIFQLQGEGLKEPHNGLKSVLLWIRWSNVIKNSCPHVPFGTRSTSQGSLKILSTSLAHLQLKKYLMAVKLAENQLKLTADLVQWVSN